MTMATGMMDKASPNGGLVHELRELTLALDSLDGAVDVMRENLVPLLRNDYPRDPGMSEGKAEPESLDSPIVDALRLTIQRVNAIRDRVDYTRERVQL